MTQTRFYFALAVLAALPLGTAAAASTATNPSADADRTAAVRGCRATYDAAPRRADGRVDADALLAQLRDLGADTYNWLVWTKNTDWDDLRAFLPLARKQGLRVWVTLVPPSESPPHAKHYSEPFRLDYERWGTEIAKLSIEHPNLVAWSIDDFTHNLREFTPEKTKQMLDAARQINPKLAFIPCCYFKGVSPRFAKAYGHLIDGVLFPYRNESVKANLTDAAAVTAEVARLRELLGPQAAIVVDVYSSRHSTLGNSTPEYVRQVIADGMKAADGVMIYCHPHPKQQREKYEVVRQLFGAARDAASQRQ
jgi:hypothetical protein